MRYWSMTYVPTDPNMLLSIVLLLLGIGTKAVLGMTMFCYDCHNIKNPNDCTTSQRCDGRTHTCVTEVHHHANEIVYSMGCRDNMHCQHHPPPEPIGKRAPGHHGHEQMLCIECCSSAYCNMHMCGSYAYQPPTTQHLPTTTMMPTPVYDPHCRNHEEDGFTCASFDLFHFCTDPASFAYVLAHEKCKQHCGFCTPGVNSVSSAPVTSPPAGVCADYEHDGFKCVSFDMFHFCTDPSSIAYVVAHEKCRKHCGFCTTGGGTHLVSGSTISATMSSTSSPSGTTPSLTGNLVSSTHQQSTQAPLTTQVQTSTTHASTTQAPNVVMNVTSIPSVTATAVSGCADIEENGFSCTYMDTFKICTTTEPLIVQLRNDKCRKHCGLCT